LNLTCEGLQLGMRARGHRDSRVGALTLLYEPSL
jgi:hypothetical protein